EHVGARRRLRPVGPHATRLNLRGTGKRPIVAGRAVVIYVVVKSENLSDPRRPETARQSLSHPRFAPRCELWSRRSRVRVPSLTLTEPLLLLRLHDCRAESRSASLARLWRIVVVVVVLAPLLVLAWIRVRQRGRLGHRSQPRDVSSGRQRLPRSHPRQILGGRWP